MVYEITDNGIKYDSWADGPQGMKFEVYPVIGQHSPEDVRAAEKQIFSNQDVVGRIRVKWVTRQEWDKMKLFLHIKSTENDRLNKELTARMVGISAREWESASQESIS
jgi:CRISPR/Cas system-associated protein endoribonuclease Cas2